MEELENRKRAVETGEAEPRIQAVLAESRMPPVSVNYYDLSSLAYG